MSDEERARQEALRRSVEELVEAVETQGKEIDRQGDLIDAMDGKLDRVVVQQAATNEEVKRLDRRLYVDNGGKSVMTMISDNRHAIALLNQAAQLEQKVAAVKEASTDKEIERVRKNAPDWKFIAIMLANAAVAVVLTLVNVMIARGELP